MALTSTVTPGSTCETFSKAMPVAVRMRTLRSDRSPRLVSLPVIWLPFADSEAPIRDGAAVHCCACSTCGVGTCAGSIVGQVPASFCWA